MTEPTTPNLGFIVPNTGDLVGSWGTAALNPDYVALDGILGGSLIVPLTNSGVTLGLPAGTIVPSSGPVQSQNALITFTGTITANITITLGMPGRYVFWNKCTPLTYYVQIASSGAGTTIGLPPGKKCSVFHDGTNCDFIDVPDTGTAYDLHGATTLPAWMLACTTLPYLVKDGTIYSIATYPTLGAMLGNTFGGDGVITFAVPDERARARIGFDNASSTSRLTTAISGINGGVMGSAGGDQSLFAHTHTTTITDPGHTHITLSNGVSAYAPLGGTGAFGQGATFENSGVDLTKASTVSAVTGISAVANSAGNGVAQNVQPSIVSFLPLVKT